jgi:hypothetical protein
VGIFAVYMGADHGIFQQHSNYIFLKREIKKSKPFACMPPTICVSMMSLSQFLEWVR